MSKITSLSSDEVRVAPIVVSPGFFRTLRIPLAAGRDFTAEDDEKHPKVAIVDQVTARQLVPSGTAKGQHIRYGVQPDMQDLEIVGVVHPARLLDVRDAASHFLYVPMLQSSGNDDGTSLLIRGDITPRLAKSIERQVESSGREYSTATSTIRERDEQSLLNEQTLATLALLFAVIAIAIAALGVFSVLSYSVTLRTQEIGVRMALGSGRKAILGLIIRDALIVALVGIGIGIPFAFVTGHLLQYMLFASAIARPFAAGIAALILLVSSLVASLFPALRAMRLNPVTALRNG